MYGLLRALLTLLLILVFGIGAWVRPACADEPERAQASVSSEIGSPGSSSDSQQEEKPSGESSDGDSESVEDGKALGIRDFGVEMPRDADRRSRTLNDELPLRGRETIRELFRPPRS